MRKHSPLLKVLTFFSPSKEYKSSMVRRFISGFLFLNIFAIFFESFHFGGSFSEGVRWFLLGSICLISLEYILRIVSAWVFLSRKAFRGFFSFFFIAEGGILLFGMLHFFSPNILDLRVFWIFRIFHFWENVPFLGILFRIFREHKKVLFFAVFLMVSAIFIFSTLIFFAEHTAQPQKFSDIPHSMWWAVGTFFTIGYGDIYPITNTGKSLATIAAFFGITIFGIMAKNRC